MFRIAFWNIQRKGPKSGIADWLAGLVRETRPDILALAECEAATAAHFLRVVNPNAGHLNYCAVADTNRVRVFCRGSISPIQLVPHDKYLHARYHLLRLERPQIPLLLACVHMISLLEKQPVDIDAQLRHLSHEIGCAEAFVGHSNTIVLGDMNANPFSVGIAAASGLHGVMSRKVVERNSRRVVTQVHPMMFNPMWQFYRGEGTTPQGTFFRGGKGEELVYFWNLFDQFLFRPSLLPYYREGQTEIVQRIQNRSLLDEAGLPNAKAVSDHLPILLTLDC